MGSSYQAVRVVVKRVKSYDRTWWEWRVGRVRENLRFGALCGGNSWWKARTASVLGMRGE